MLYAAKNISAGSLIVREDIVIKEIGLAKIPQGGVFVKVQRKSRTQE